MDDTHLAYDRRKQTVTQILNELEIKDYQIHHGSYQTLNKPGDAIQNEQGTLGGFAKKIPKHVHENKNDTKCKASSIVALVSRHVVINSETDEKISLHLGDVKVGEAIIHQIERLDIVPVDIFPEFVEDCQTEYIHYNGKTMYAHIPDEDFWKTSMNQFVFLWGQNLNSKPAAGYIQNPNFNYGDKPTVCTILIRERNRQPVSEPGDSGSIVCALSRKQDKLYALAMIMGRFKHSVDGYGGPCYIALRLGEAFSMLEGLYSASFKLCDENDKK
ncbi:hypothetical protein DPMN_119250 [Dreissena polymorpha]|uniref:Uncharacterized protein n=1 Tax=Dreissena polymorpha TaxID=45954 RepID=A0A9D4GM43_DREPO|nr:hypothetical protein DPMN_119250 [Dreissena polymorpha]